MIQLGVAGGPVREYRDSYTDVVVSALVSAASGSSSRAAHATGALETCASAWARAMAAADVAPVTAATVGVDEAFLADVGRRLIRSGDAAYMIEVGPDGVRLLPASSWDVRGGYDPAGWRYRVNRAGPDTTTTRTLPADGVVHLRWATSPGRPWQGVSPLAWASETGRLSGALEEALADESTGPRGHVLPIPESQREPTDEDAEGDDPLAGLRRDLVRLRGSLALVETMAGGYGDRGGRPDADWKPRRVGAEPPDVLARLRSDAALSVYSACGVPPSLVTLSADGTGQREAWRRFLHGSVSPVARIVERELRAKLDTPTLSLDFTALYAADVRGRFGRWPARTRPSPKTRRAGSRGWPDGKAALPALRGGDLRCARPRRSR